MRSIRSLGLASAFALLLFLSYQFFSYRQYTLEATVITAKTVMSLETRDDRFAMGKICWTLKRFRCAEKTYQKWVDLEPSNLIALSGLARSMTMLHHEHEAMPYYRAYFASGGNDVEAMRCYAKSLLISGQPEESVQWYYQALYFDRHNRELAAELLQTLKNQHRDFEALSLREQLALLTLNERAESDEETPVDPSAAARPLEKKKAKSKISFAFFKRQPDRHFASVTESAKNAEKEMSAKDSDRFMHAEGPQSYPSFDGRAFLLPIWHSNLVDFVSASFIQPESQVSTGDLTRWGVKVQKLFGNKVRISGLKIGDNELAAFEAKACDDCESLIASDLLRKFSARLDDQRQFSFLILEPSGR